MGVAAPPRKPHVWYLRRSLWRDARNLVRYGLNAPRWGQLIWFDPGECTSFVEYNRSYTGQVMGGDWDIETIPLSEHEKFVACRRHWLDAVSWEDTGIIDLLAAELPIRGSVDGCRTREDLVSRYQALDDVFAIVEREGRFRTRKELDPHAYREVGGILIHVGRNGQPIFGTGGCHRLAMAQVIGLARVPAQVGLVHELALPEWRREYS